MCPLCVASTALAAAGAGSGGGFLALCIVKLRSVFHRQEK
jgi:hypothetical protein